MLPKAGKPAGGATITCQVLTAGKWDHEIVTGSLTRPFAPQSPVLPRKEPGRERANGCSDAA